MPIDSNADDLFGRLKDLINSIDFNIPGIESSWGKDAAGGVAEGIIDRSRTEHAGADFTWPENKPRYRRWKLRRYGVSEPNVRTGQMLSEASMLGDVQIVDDGKTVSMHYGTGEAPSTSIGGYISDADKEVTDREKAHFAHDGQGPEKTKRPFFELDDNIRDENVLPICEEAIGKFIAANWKS